MPLTKQLIEQAEREKLEEALTPPPDGQRSGEGAASILPHLSRTLRSNPAARRDPRPPKSDQDTTR